MYEYRSELARLSPPAPSRVFLTDTRTDAIGAMLDRITNHEVNQRLRHIQCAGRVLQGLFTQAHELEGRTGALRAASRRRSPGSGGAARGVLRRCKACVGPASTSAIDSASVKPLRGCNLT